MSVRPKKTYPDMRCEIHYISFNDNNGCIYIFIEVETVNKLRCMVTLSEGHTLVTPENLNMASF